MSFKKITLAFLAALLFLGLPLGYYLLSRNPAPVPLQFTAATRKEIRVVVSTNGIIEPVDRTDVVAPIDGFVTSVPLKEGSAVRKGQRILNLESKQDLTALVEARAALLRAKAEALPVLSGPRKEELAAVDSSMAENDLQLAQVRADLRTEEALLARQATTRAAVESLQKHLQLLSARAAALKQQKEGLLNRHSPEEKQWEQDRIAELTKQVDLLEGQIRNGTVTAPRNGLLYSLSVRSGSYVGRGQVLGQLYEPGKIRLRAYVDEPDLGRIQKGQQVLIDWDGLPDQHWTATVEVPAEQVVALGNRSVGHVLCAIDGSPTELIPNINVKVQIVTARKSAALVVPRIAVLNQNGRQTILISNGKAASPVEVRLGLVTAEEVEILQGINEGASVVINPAEARRQ